jgi:hypothetical protein
MIREDIIENFVPAVREVLSSIKLHVTNVIAEAHQVVLEARGEPRTGDGRDNRYCLVLELRDGEVAAIHESLFRAIGRGAYRYSPSNAARRRWHSAAPRSAGWRSGFTMTLPSSSSSIVKRGGPVNINLRHDHDCPPPWHGPLLLKKMI